jgi:hypothetical protein
MDLRPLTLGEQLDCAVTLCVRNALTLSLIYIVFSVLTGVCQLYGGTDEAKLIGGAMDVFRSHGGHVLTQKDISALIDRKSTFNGFTVAGWCTYIFLYPLVHGALFFAASCIYFATPVTFWGAYQKGMRFWLPIVGIGILYFVIGLLFYIILSILGFAGFLAISLLPVHALSIFLGLLWGIFLLIIVFLVSCLIWFGINISCFTCVVERIGFMSAFSRGLERVFSSVGFQRSLIAAFALAAVYIGLAVVNMAGLGVLYGVLRSNVAGTVFTVALQLVSEIFITVFLAVFYYDLRVRREGFDLKHEVATVFSVK